MGALGGLNALSGPTDIAHDSIDSQDIAIDIESLYRDIGTSRAAFTGFHCKSLSEFSRSSATVFSDLWRSMLLERAARSPLTSSTSRISHDRSQHAALIEASSRVLSKWKKAARGGLTECVGNERRDQAKNAYP